jgi:hypothetical protein
MSRLTAGDGGAERSLDPRGYSTQNGDAMVPKGTALSTAIDARGVSLVAGVVVVVGLIISLLLVTQS